MAGLHRLSAVACQEMTEAVMASNELGMVILDAVSDGKIDAQEIRAIWTKKLALDREMGEAMLAAEEADNIEAHYEFAKKAGLHAQPHQYLREKDASLERLRAQYGHNKKRTAITALGRTIR